MVQTYTMTTSDKSSSRHIDPCCNQKKRRTKFKKMMETRSSLWHFVSPVTRVIDLKKKILNKNEQKKFQRIYSAVVGIVARNS